MTCTAVRGFGGLGVRGGGRWGGGQWEKGMGAEAEAGKKISIEHLQDVRE